MSRKRYLVAALVLPLLLVSCTSDDDDGGGSAAGSATGAGGAGTYGYTFAVVTHGSAGDSFWDVVKRGAEQAGSDEGVTVNYQGDGDPQRQAQLIDAAVNENVDGIVVSMANPDALQSSIEAAVAADIPVITINSGGIGPRSSARSHTWGRTKPSPDAVPASRWRRPASPRRSASSTKPATSGWNSDALGSRRGSADRSRTCRCR